MSDQNTIPRAQDLAFHTRCACEQLTRYGGAVWSVELLDLLENLTDLNDDLQHGRAPELVHARIAEAKLLLDRVASVDWSSKTPNMPGWYWCHQRGETRMVNVWKYTTVADSRLFTNEDGGSLVADKELYGAAKWQGPIEPPTPPSNAKVQADGAGLIAPVAPGTTG